MALPRRSDPSASSLAGCSSTLTEVLGRLDIGCRMVLVCQLHHFWGLFHSANKNLEGYHMGRFARLQLVGRITYYLGWIALVCGGLVHLNIAKAQFLKIDLSQRNLLELSVVCFLICVATELRALALAGNEMPSVVKRPMAA